MKYFFVCPLEGCSLKMEAEVENKNEAIDKLTDTAKEHLKNVHPEVFKTDEQIRADITTGMQYEALVL